MAVNGGMARLLVTLLGGFEVRSASGPPLALPSRKIQALLAYLARQPGRPVARDTLAALLWGDTSDRQARKSLRQALYVLRKALPGNSPALRVDAGHFMLDSAYLESDVAEFERAVADGSPEALERAATLYRGDFLEGFHVSEAPFEDWLMAERERLRELALEALARLLAHQSSSGLTERAIQTAVRLLALDPLQEVVHRTLMRLYARQGRRSAALRQYQVCVEVLERELGAESEVETRQLYQEILRRAAPEPNAAAPPGATEPPRRRRQAHRDAPPVHLELPLPETPVIGRESELAQLREALEDLGRGRGRVVAVLGEAGIGKSRLLLALASEAQQRGGRVLLGRCYQSERVLGFAPWVGALRAGRVVEEAERRDTATPIRRAGLAGLLPEASPRDGDLASQAEDELGVFESVAQLIVELAARQPLAVLLEDVHWADEMSLRLLAFVARRVHAAPALIAITAREEELSSVPMLRDVLTELAREAHFTRVALQPLSRPATTDLVHALARAGSGEAAVGQLAERVWAVCEGNPFVTVETVRAIQEGRIREGASGLPLAERVRELIAGRLERLSERARVLLASAAVIGRGFEFILLQRASGLDEREAAEGLEELVRRRVLHGIGETFDFTHERTREVAYTELLLPRRKLLHAGVAAALEEVHAGNLEPHYPALGLHYGEAEVWDKAVTCLLRAGAQAAARSAHREAAVCLEQALLALGHLPRTRDTIAQAIDIRFELRHSLVQIGELGRLLEHLRVADVLATSLGDRRRAGWVSDYMSNYLYLVGKNADAFRSGEQALSTAQDTGDFALKVAATFHMGCACYAMGDYRRAIELLNRNVEAVEANRNDRLGLAVSPSILSRCWLGWCLAEAGEFVEAMSRATEAIDLAESTERRLDLLYACRGLGFVCVRKGELTQAIVTLERGLALCQLIESRALSHFLASLLGLALALSGRLAEALPLLMQAVDQAASMGRGRDQPFQLGALAEAYLLAGCTKDAMEFAASALEGARAQEQRGQEAYALRLLGEVTSRSDGHAVDESEHYYGLAMALAEVLGMRPLLAHCHLGLGRLYRRTERGEEARTQLARARELFRSMQMTLWVQQAEVSLAEA
jgi:DNA-binding SARP family transcriptional activator